MTYKLSGNINITIVGLVNVLIFQLLLKGQFIGMFPYHKLLTMYFISSTADKIHNS